MTGKIFLNYRREDTAGFAQALFARLEQTFRAESLFMGVEGGIKPGQDFVEVLEEQVSACDVMLVLIGPNWLTARDDSGRRRLDSPVDFVRVEVESALRFAEQVIPVLVQKTEMPRADALPESLKALARRNAVGLTHERFKPDGQRLIKVLEDALTEMEEARRRIANAAAASAEKLTTERAAKVEEVTRAIGERVKLHAVAVPSPEQNRQSGGTGQLGFHQGQRKHRGFSRPSCALSTRCERPLGAGRTRAAGLGGAASADR